MISDDVQDRILEESWEQEKEYIGQKPYYEVPWAYIGEAFEDFYGIWYVECLLEDEEGQEVIVVQIDEDDPDYGERYSETKWTVEDKIKATKEKGRQQVVQAALEKYLAKHPELE